MRYIRGAGLMLLLLLVHCQGHSEPCLTCPDYVRESIVYKKRYPFLHYEYDIFQWERYEALEPLIFGFQNANNRKVKVLHIGDSHVQADIFTYEIRNRLHKVLGYGGRGIVFPYAAARTHSAHDYSTSFHGTWESAKNVQFKPKLDLGFSGVTVRTYDKKASFTIKFFPNEHHHKNKVLKIYRKYDEKSYDLKIYLGPFEKPVYVNTRQDSSKPYIQVVLPSVPNEITFYIYASDVNQKFFECYGISFETEENKGLIYHSVGINGAGLFSILRQNVMDEQIAEMQPDVILIDLGGNDYYSGMNVPVYEETLRSLVSRFQAISPNTTIVISCSHDLYRGGLSIPECAKAQRIAKQIAWEEGCVFFDYYNTFGGRYAMLKWYKNNLAQMDRVHLNYPGYLLRGELYANAFLNTFYKVLLEGALPSHNLPLELPGHSPEPSTAPVHGTTTSKNKEKSSIKKSFHHVQKGEYLAMIARKYQVSVDDIIQWNQLPNYTIYVGQRLAIVSKQPQTTAIKPNVTYAVSKPKTTTSMQKSTPTLTSGVKSIKTYKVQYGNNLWTIARKYQTTVQKLIELNPGKDKRLMPGDVLRLPK